MREQEVSRTALATAYLRAAHQILDGAELILKDPIAIKLLDYGAESPINESTQSFKAERFKTERFDTPEDRALRCHVVLRSRYAEDRLSAAVKRGVTQYVLIGAGFDTFALRQPDWAKQLTIVEVDHPATQLVKRQRIAAAGLGLPGNLRFADIDFESESLLDGLTRHKVLTDRPTFFSWLGVSMYLTESAIDKTIQDVASFPKGSELVMTFSQPPAANRGASIVVAARLAQRVADAGEPFISFFDPAELERKLLEAGFDGVEFLTPALAKSRYFDSIATSLPSPKRISIVAAIRR